MAATGSDGQRQALTTGSLLERTPLWYYVLAEAAHGGGNRLGPVGSTIVADVLIGLVRRSEDSILAQPDWAPTLPSRQPGTFTLFDLLAFAGVLPRTYKAQDGDSLSTIARDQLGDFRRWPEIFVLNRDAMDHRDRIRPGQVFSCPVVRPPSCGRCCTNSVRATRCKILRRDTSATGTARPRSTTSTST